MHNPKLGRYVLNKVRFWPLAIVLFGFFILKMHLLLHLHYSYTDLSSKHLFWHPAYCGLFVHPDGKSKYGVDSCDTYNFLLVSNISYELYGTKDWATLGGYELLESILKDEYMKFMVQNPSYFIKIVLFLCLYVYVYFRML